MRSPIASLCSATGARSSPAPRTDRSPRKRCRADAPEGARRSYPAKRPKADADGDILLQTRSLGGRRPRRHQYRAPPWRDRRRLRPGRFRHRSSRLCIVWRSTARPRADSPAWRSSGAADPRMHWRAGDLLVPGDRKTQGLTPSQRTDLQCDLGAPRQGFFEMGRMAEASEERLIRLRPPGAARTATAAFVAQCNRVFRRKPAEDRVGKGAVSRG